MANFEISEITSDGGTNPYERKKSSQYIQEFRNKVYCKEDQINDYILETNEEREKEEKKLQKKRLFELQQLNKQEEADEEPQEIDLRKEITQKLLFQESLEKNFDMKLRTYNQFEIYQEIEPLLKESELDLRKIKQKVKGFDQTRNNRFLNPKRTVFMTQSESFNPKLSLLQKATEKVQIGAQENEENEDLQQTIISFLKKNYFQHEKKDTQDDNQPNLQDQVINNYLFNNQKYQETKLKSINRMTNTVFSNFFQNENQTKDVNDIIKIIEQQQEKIVEKKQKEEKIQKIAEYLQKKKKSQTQWDDNILEEKKEKITYDLEFFQFNKFQVGQTVENVIRETFRTQWSNPLIRHRLKQEHDKQQMMKQYSVDNNILNDKADEELFNKIRTRLVTSMDPQYSSQMPIAQSAPSFLMHERFLTQPPEKDIYTATPNNKDRENKGSPIKIKTPAPIIKKVVVNKYEQFAVINPKNYVKQLEQEEQKLKEKELYRNRPAFMRKFRSGQFFSQSLEKQKSGLVNKSRSEHSSIAFIPTQHTELFNNSISIKDQERSDILGSIIHSGGNPRLLQDNYQKKFDHILKRIDEKQEDLLYYKDEFRQEYERLMKGEEDEYNKLLPPVIDTIKEIKFSENAQIRFARLKRIRTRTLQNSLNRYLDLY